MEYDNKNYCLETAKKAERIMKTGTIHLIVWSCMTVLLSILAYFGGELSTGCGVIGLMGFGLLFLLGGGAAAISIAYIIYSIKRKKLMTLTFALVPFVFTAVISHYSFDNIKINEDLSLLQLRNEVEFYKQQHKTYPTTIDVFYLGSLDKSKINYHVESEYDNFFIYYKDRFVSNLHAGLEGQPCP